MEAKLIREKLINIVEEKYLVEKMIDNLHISPSDAVTWFDVQVGRELIMYVKILKPSNIRLVRFVNNIDFEYSVKNVEDFRELIFNWSD